MAKVYSSSHLTKRRKYQIENTLHEGAVAVSGEKIFPDRQLEEVQQLILEAFNAMNGWVLDRAGIIGHIKGFILSWDKSLMYSATGAEVDCRLLETAGKAHHGVHVSVACIVFNIPQLELEEKLIALFDQLENIRKESIVEE